MNVYSADNSIFSLLGMKYLSSKIKKNEDLKYFLEIIDTVHEEIITLSTEDRTEKNLETIVKNHTKILYPIFLRLTQQCIGYIKQFTDKLGKFCEINQDIFVSVKEELEYFKLKMVESKNNFSIFQLRQIRDYLLSQQNNPKSTGKMLLQKLWEETGLNETSIRKIQQSDLSLALIIESIVSDLQDETVKKILNEKNRHKYDADQLVDKDTLAPTIDCLQQFLQGEGEANTIPLLELRISNKNIEQDDWTIDPFYIELFKIIQEQTGFTFIFTSNSGQSYISYDYVGVFQEEILYILKELKAQKEPEQKKSVETTIESYLKTVSCFEITDKVLKAMKKARNGEKEKILDILKALAERNCGNIRPTLGSSMLDFGSHPLKGVQKIRGNGSVPKNSISYDVGSSTRLVIAENTNQEGKKTLQILFYGDYHDIMK